ncbi:MAG: site-specific integrase [Pirellulales bacterium]|nr:site-specific integrase [Pirellulales bacterium]
MKFPKPWFRPERGVWYVTLDGKQHNLGPDRAAAFNRYRTLLKSPPKKRKKVEHQSVAVVLDNFLEWTKKHRALRTYEWYLAHCQSFAKTLPENMSVEALKPYHVQQWVDGHDDWADGHKRGGMVAVQRAFNWAEKLGYLERSPIHYLEKPKAGRRETIVTPAEFPVMLAAIRRQEFRDLVVTAWETGARPQELIRVEARHVDLQNARWVFPPHEAKVKTRPRIVYLSDTALAITKRLMLKHPKGPLFRNTKGRPWVAYSLNCQYTRIQERLGRRVCLYVLRHSFATRMLEAGVDALTVAILLGHANPAMLSLTYQHLSHNPKHMLDQIRQASA